MFSKKFEILTILTVSAVFCFCDGSEVKRYTPDWTSLDSRPLPEVKKLKN